ncbi:mitochondrial amidoxime-reducing component 1-like [Haemaphysalis longicornis]
MTEDSLASDDRRIKFYTGERTYAILLTLFNFLERGISHGPRNSLSKFQELMLTLVRKIESPEDYFKGSCFRRGIKLYASNHVYGVKEDILSETAPSEIVARCIPQMKSNCNYDARLEVGLVAEQPWLCGSPDGLVITDSMLIDYKKGISHVKFIQYVDDKLTLKSSHEYYTQLMVMLMRTFSYNAVEVSEEASQWFRDYLQSDSARLVKILLDQDALDRGKNCPTPVACQDESAFHVLSKASLDELLSRLPPGSNIGRDNFQPALFVDNCEAHTEDHWERVRIRDAEQAVSHRTTRCILTTVDQVAAVRTDKEPLTTLRKYRVDQLDRGRQQYQSQPLLGISTYRVAPGRITVGDTVYAQVSPEPLL